MSPLYEPLRLLGSIQLSRVCYWWSSVPFGSCNLHRSSLKITWKILNADMMKFWYVNAWTQSMCFWFCSYFRFSRNLFPAVKHRLSTKQHWLIVKVKFLVSGVIPTIPHLSTDCLHPSSSFVQLYSAAAHGFLLGWGWQIC